MTFVTLKYDKSHPIFITFYYIYSLQITDVQNRENVYDSNVVKKHLVFWEEKT